MVNNYYKPAKLTFKDALSKLLIFIMCGLAVLAVYIVFIFISISFIYDFLDSIPETIVAYFWPTIYNILYIIPLFFVLFIKNDEYRRYILHISKSGFNIKSVIKEFTLDFGKYDLIIYSVYCLIMLVPDKIYRDYICWITVQQAVFLEFPIPKIISVIMAIISFAIQYYICLIVSANYWNKNRFDTTKEIKMENN